MLPCQAARSAAVVFGIAAVAAAIPSNIITIGAIIRTGTIIMVTVVGTSPPSSAVPFAAITRASPIVVVVHVYIINNIYNIDQLNSQNDTTQLAYCARNYYFC